MRFQYMCFVVCVRVCVYVCVCGQQVLIVLRNLKCSCPTVCEEHHTSWIFCQSVYLFA
jgi:hypothetical protein